jgi:hypothetical protein
VVHALLEQRREQEQLRGGPERRLEASKSVREVMTSGRGALSRELGRSDARLELTEQAESSLREERDRLQAQLEAERAERRRLAEQLGEARKGFWRRLFGGG